MRNARGAATQERAGALVAVRDDVGANVVGYSDAPQPVGQIHREARPMTLQHFFSAQEFRIRQSLRVPFQKLVPRENPRNVLTGPQDLSAPWHGTLTGYTKFKCRCALCLGANADYSRDKRARRKARGICSECNQPVLPGVTRCAVHMARNWRACKEFRHAKARRFGRMPQPEAATDHV